MEEEGLRLKSEDKARLVEETRLNSEPEEQARLKAKEEEQIAEEARLKAEEHRQRSRAGGGEGRTCKVTTSF